MAGHFQTNQVTLSTTAGQVGQANGRATLQVLNTDTILTIYLGTTNRVSSTTGFPLLAGAGYKFTSGAQQQVWAVAASGSPVVAILEEFAL